MHSVGKAGNVPDVLLSAKEAEVSNPAAVTSLTAKHTNQVQSTIVYSNPRCREHIMHRLC